MAPLCDDDKNRAQWRLTRSIKPSLDIRFTGANLIDYSGRVKHLLAAYLAATLIIGAASLLVLYLVNRRLKSRVLACFPAICACLEFSVLQSLLLFYLGINISDRIGRGALVLIFSSFPSSYLMLALIPIMIHRLYALVRQI